MTLHELLQQHNKSVPDIEFFANTRNLSMVSAIDYRNRFIFLPINTVINSADLNILNLHIHYDVSKADLLGIIGFVETPREVNHLGTIVAFIDTEFIILKGDGSIIIVDGYDCDHTLYKCAQTEEKFYDALSICLRLFSKQIRRESFTKDWRNSVLKDAALAAGGIEYFPFYDTYLG